MTWTSLSNGLPEITVNDILLDPDIPNTVYAATDIGVYRSVDDGQSWLPLGEGLPNVIVHALSLYRPTRTLRAATYGRGMWDLAVPTTGQTQVTISATTPGAYSSLEDGTTYEAPITFYWYSGAQHTVTWLSAVSAVPGTQFVFSGWTDGVTQNARIITVGSSAATFTANISVQYLLTVTALPAGAGTVVETPSSPSGYYNAGTSVQLSATSAAGYFFWYLSGDLTGSLPQSITMNAPHNVTVNFYCGYTYNYFPNQIGAGATSGLFQVETGAGCPWSLSPGANWLTSVPSSGIGSATVGFTVSPNAGTARSTTLMVTGYQGYNTDLSLAQDASATSRPMIDSVQPNSGTGRSQTFTFQFEDLGGYADVLNVQMNFEPGFFSQPACDVYAYVGSPSSPYLYLLNDSGTSYLGPITLPGTSTLQNSQCTVSASGSSVGGSGNLLNVNLAVSFTPSFAGNTNVSASAYDGVTNSGSDRELLGTWTIPTGSGIAQNITFGSLSNEAFEAAPFTVSATASSGLPVSFNSQTMSVCTVSGPTVTLVSVGTCTIQATQPGNGTYAAATPVNQSFAVTQGTQSITFGSLSNQAFGSAAFTVSATASSGLPVSFSSQTMSVCTVSGTTVTFVNVGICTIVASQSGNTNWAAATSVNQSFAVTQGTQSITFGSLSNQTLRSASFTVSATASSGLPVSLNSQTVSVCTVSGTTVTLVTIGTCTIQATQSGNTNWAAAPMVSQSFTVTPGSGGGPPDLTITKSHSGSFTQGQTGATYTITAGTAAQAPPRER